jgi:hypothetical protein
VNASCRQLVLAGLIVATGQACGTPPDDVYLFDCAGWIQRIDAVSATRPVHVSEIDSTLPDRVRDGCAIRAGWRDADGNTLMLAVQTQALLDEDGEVPTKVLALATPRLFLLAEQGPLPEQPATPDRRGLAERLEAVEGPFRRSAAYLLSDGTTLLLQELTERMGESGLRHPVWHAGSVSLNQAQPDATGRYALVDISSGTQRGGVVSATEAADDHRLVCFTPDGTIYVAVARQTLLLLDVMDPAQHTVIGDLAVDLYWSACASR